MRNFTLILGSWQNTKKWGFFLIEKQIQVSQKMFVSHEMKPMYSTHNAIG